MAPTVAVLGGAGKSGSLSLAAARAEGAGRTVGIVPVEREAQVLRDAGIADVVALADARDPVGVADAVVEALGAPADITIVCVTVPGCEHGAVLATAEGGTVIFFSMATSFTAAALGAEGLAADVTMLIGNGYTRGHAAYALDLIRTDDAIRALFEARRRRPGSTQVIRMKLLLQGGPIYAPTAPGAEAMLVVDGTVAWIGPAAGAEVHRDTADAVVDLDGALVAPAFVDAHVHHTATGMTLLGLDLRGVASRGQLLELLSAQARRLRGRPIVGHGWDETAVARPALPTRAELDRATWGSVVYLSRVDVHSALVSSH